LTRPFHTSTTRLRPCVRMRYSLVRCGNLRLSYRRQKGEVSATPSIARTTLSLMILKNRSEKMNNICDG
jgi:hypothetical protein